MRVDEFYVTRAELEDRKRRFLENCILVIVPEYL